MGNRTSLSLVSATDEFAVVFEANNALPFFWTAAFTQSDLEPWAEACRNSVRWDPTEDDRIAPSVPPLELRIPWIRAEANLRAALVRARDLPPGYEARMKVFVSRLASAAQRLGAGALVLDAVEWTNFYSQEQDAADALSRLIAAWHGDGHFDLPAIRSLHEVDGEATHHLGVDQRSWPSVPLVPTPVAEHARQEGLARELIDWAWAVAIAGTVLGVYAATGSKTLAAAAGIGFASAFVWKISRRNRR